MSKPWALYNEIDDFAAAWLEQLIVAGHIAPGIVDRRSIADLCRDDLRGFRQVHFFAGIGVWSYALRRAGITDDTALWTGSCPCQPFSAAGAGGGMDDERHLWPHFHHLIRECEPDLVFGEQVASKDGLAWLDLVSADMEGSGYALGALDTCAAGFGAPHIRQRLYWVAERLANTSGERGRAGLRCHGSTGSRRTISSDGSAVLDVGDALGAGLEGYGRGSSATAGHWKGPFRPATATGELGGMADNGCEHGFRWADAEGFTEAHSRGRIEDPVYDQSRSCLDHLAYADLINGDGAGSGAGNEGGELLGSDGLCGFENLIGLADDESRGRGVERSTVGAREIRYADLCGDTPGRLADSDDRQLSQSRRRSEGRDGTPTVGSVDNNGWSRPTNGFWNDVDWLFCRDGRWRPIEPGTFPLAHGTAARVGRLRGYGNAINAEQAIGFIEAYLEAQAPEIDLEPLPDSLVLDFEPLI